MNSQLPSSRMPHPVRTGRNSSRTYGTAIALCIVHCVLLIAGCINAVSAQHSHKESIYKVTFLLPINTYLNYSLDTTLATGLAINSTLDKETVNNLEFYEGALNAIDSLKKDGWNVQVNVIDAFDSASVVKAKQNSLLKNADLIITNLNQNLTGLLSNYAVSGKPVIVSCNTNTSVTLKSNPACYFTTPSSLLQCREMAAWTANQLYDKKFIIFKTDNSKEKERTNTIYNSLREKEIKAADITLFDTTGKKPEMIATHMIKGKKNFIFLPSTNEAYASDVINYLKTLIGEYDFMLIGLPTWEYFESVNPMDLQAVHTVIFSSVFIDYKASPVEAFRKYFRDKYSTEPSENAFIGYDAAMIFGHQLLKHGTEFNENLLSKTFTGLTTDYHFTRLPSPGFENDYISILLFEDYSLKKLNK